jgi:ElaB/YqjD/DUF883 family membrane-anchored ribosome-binding protein
MLSLDNSMRDVREEVDFLFSEILDDRKEDAAKARKRAIKEARARVRRATKGKLREDMRNMIDAAIGGDGGV